MLKPRIVSRLMSHAALILFAILASVIPGHAATGDITTVAGDGTAAFSGDTGQATAANLNYPSGVAVDSNGNVYVADLYNSRIRKVTPGGVITTVAGNGTPGYVSSEDGGPATAASLNYSYGVAVDSSGNIYIADTFNHRIRRVTPGGVITTVAGNGTGGSSGDGGLAISASLNGPRSVAVDSSGNIYIADYVNHRIRKVTPGGVITTVAGNGTLGYSGDSGPATSAMLRSPWGVAVDSSGNIYIADTDNSRIRKVTPGGVITTVAGNGTPVYSGDGGPATLASLKYPYGVAVDSSGNIYIADSQNNRIRKVQGADACITWDLLSTTAVTSVVGNINGQPESMGGGSSSPFMSIYGYSNGQQLWVGNTGWVAGPLDIARYVQFNASPTTGNTFTVTNVSFNYSDFPLTTDFNILNFQAYYSTDNWVNSTVLNSTALVYLNTAMSTFNVTGLNVPVASGSTFSLRIYPYALQNGIAMTPTFAIHNNVAFCGTTAPEVLDTGTLTIVKDAAPNDAQDFAFYAFGPNSGSIMPFLLDDDAGAVGADNILSNSKTFTLAPGSYSVKEDFYNPVPVTGWDSTGIICTSSTGTMVGTVDLAIHAFTVDLAAGDNVTCTFTNTPKVQGADACITWDILSTTAVTSVVGNINGQPESMGGGSSSPFMSIYGYSNGQQLWVGNTGWVAGPLDIARYVQFNASPTTGNTFTVTNVSFNYGDFPLTTDFNILNFQAYYSTDNWVNSTLLNSTALVYLNTAMSTFNVTGLNVPVASGSTFSLRIYPYALQNGIAMTPTFAIHNNVAFCGTTAPEVLDTGTLTIVKDAAPNDAQDFAFYAFGPNSGSIMPFLLDDDAGAVGADNILSNSKTFTLAPGSYSVKEDFYNPVPVTGWDSTGIVCTSSTGMTVGTVDLAIHAFTVDLAAGDNVTCTFTNTKQPTGTGTLTIVKDAQPDDPQDFHFTTVGTGLSDFDLDDDPNNGTLPNSKTFTNLAAGVSFTVTEDAVSGWTVPSIQCIVAVPGSTTTFTDQLNRTFTVNLEAGANVTCTFINTKQPPTVSSLGNCTSTNATVSSCQEISPPSGAPFTPQRAVSIGLTGVTGSADICITFNNPPPNNLVFFKYVNNQWKNLYPGNSLSGISNVTYSNGQICFTIQDNSDADEDNTIGTITDPVVIGDDVAQPVMSISTLSDNSVTNNNILNISGTVTDNIGVQGLTVNGNSVAINTDGSFSHALVLSEGANVITAVATDLAGNQTTDSRTITYDITLPTLTVSTPADNSQTRDVALIVTGTVSKTVTVEIKNITNSTTTYATVTGTDYSGAIQLASGSNTIEVTGTDLAGNKSTSVKRTILYDPNSPALAITDPAHDIQLHSPTTYTIKGTVTDQTNTVVSLTFNNIIYTPAVSSGQFQQEITLSDEGNYRIAVTATDAVGNPPSTATRNIIYTPYPGNINGDGSATSLIEVLKAFQYVIGTAPLTPTEKLRLDCAPLGPDGKPNPNGEVDTADVILLLRRIVGLVNW